jgi:hypothetical protein
MIPAFAADLDLACFPEDDSYEDIAEILTVACESFSSRSIPSSHGDMQ